MRRVFIVVIGIVILSSIAILLARQAPPVVDLPSPVTALGQASAITVHARDPHGIRSLAAFVEQNGVQYPVWETTQPSGVTDGTLSFAAGTNTTPQAIQRSAQISFVFNRVQPRSIKVGIFMLCHGPRK